MIIQCDRCSTKFRLDDSRVTGAGVRVKCTKCQNIFLVTPPEETPVEEILSVGPSERLEKERSIPRSPEGPNLSLDFTPPSDRSGGGTQEDSSSKSKDPALFSNFDFSFSVDARSGEAGSGNLPEDEKWRGISQQAGRVGTDNDLSESDELSSPNADDGQGKGLSVDDSPFKGFDFDEAESKDATSEVPVQDEWPSGASGEDTYDLSRSEAAIEEEQEPARPVSGAGEYTGQSVALKDKGPSDKDSQEPPVASKDAFSKLLSESLKKDIREKDVTVNDAEDEEDVLGFEPEEGFEAQGVTKGRTAAPFSKAGMRIPPALIAIIVFLVGGGIIYFSGIIDSIARRLAPSEAPKSVEIEDVKVSYVDNQNFGKFFVIEARLKNISDSPQPVKRVTGIAYGKDGEKIMSLSVAPGRVVTPDDLKILPKEELARQFKDPSGGMIPPKGTVPVMVIFTDISSGVSEAGVDIAQ